MQRAGAEDRGAATPYDAKGLLKAAIRDDDPVIFLEQKILYDTAGEIPEGECCLPIGKADIKKEGRDITIITYGSMLSRCLEAAGALEAGGVMAEVVDLRTLRPLDRETVLASARKTGLVMIVHEAPKTGGFGARWRR